MRAPLSLLLLAVAVPAWADPQLSAWVTDSNAKYARIYRSDADRLAGVTATTWGNGRNVQASPAHAGISSIAYSEQWIYLTTSDLAPYVMGPWYMDPSRTMPFVNLPVNQHATYRIPRTATLAAPPAVKRGTQGRGEDAIGYFVDGVAMFDPTDGWAYSHGRESMPGFGEWHRDAYVNERPTFDPGNSHQQMTGKYHNHADPIALRHLLGDHVDFDPATKLYAESQTAPARHSPILGWMRDGYPVYGPFGYAQPLDATSGIRRMVGGFVRRDGKTPGVDDLASAGRTLPAWALRNSSHAPEDGPDVSASYPLGRYIEDWAYLGDLIKPATGQPYQVGADFDLNEYNVRYCVTPEFPNGTYAYFLNIDTHGTPVFPYNTNRYFFGNPTGGTASPSERVVSFFQGAQDPVEKAQPPGDTTLAWNGGGYRSNRGPGLASVIPANARPGTTTTLTIMLNPAAPKPPPPPWAPISSVELSRPGAPSIYARSFWRDSTTGAVKADFALPANASGSYTVSTIFGPNSWSLTDGFTVR